MSYLLLLAVCAFMLVGCGAGIGVDTVTTGEGASVAEAAGGVATYSNPIMAIEDRGGADPAVISHQGRFYFYSTNSGLNVFISDDLVNWTRGPQVLPDTLKGTWAPEVYHHPENGKFYMYYTHRYKIGVAVADRPDEMFTDLGLLAINGIDAHMFRDDDGRLYLYFTHTPAFSMYCIPMKSPTETGGPVTKCFEISQDWERNEFALNEGPWIIKRDGIYYMLYSGSDGQSIHYAVGYATAPTPIGPFTKYEGNPVFKNLPAVNGPGHGSVIGDKTGQLWHLYHQKVDTQRGWKRDICLDPIGFDEDGIFGGLPTRGIERPVPNFDPSLVWVPEIHPRGAVFNEPVEVRLTCHTPQAEIRYTLDGSEPGPESTLYKEPLTIAESCTVKVRAFKAEMRPSYVAEMRFSRIDGPPAANPSPHGVTESVPFEIFEKPNRNWQPPPKPAATE